ncbi:hypothetical protein VTK26DRAFT_6171 [Humicola hyalothermophila]
MNMMEAFHHRFIFLLWLCFSVATAFALPSFRYLRPSTRTTTDHTVCRNEAYHPFDYAVKLRPDPQAPLCPVEAVQHDNTLAGMHARDLLMGRQVTQEQDYSCGPDRPCRNGACCPKATGWCNYGPEACGTDGQSPNDVCWSNCDAKAECGRYADPPGKECPLNVCCSPWGFCGMTEDFCKVTDDEETSCQSNCEQPGSGASNGNIRNRIVGYYEAWVHSRKCNGMSIEQIPVAALTHLMFSFAYITPGDFRIVPMDDLDPNLFQKMTALKRRNKALKVMVALGGWTFNDPGPTQTVFHDVAKSKENRTTFINNLLSFMRQYAFDGVDFDWEYPGAEDRGGQEEDGQNFTLLLKELKEAIKKQPLEYVVSFTTPTSYWYLRHFDIKGSTDAVDFVNIMSYDLHGVWDAWNPIGSRVLAHTNLTEIKLALDLYWRSNIPPKKLNLGFGFYGRSFTLTDPTCYKPGCQFSGGAAPGPCTQNSGTLAYREIVDIIEKHKLKPYYDKEHQVKYIVWNQNQWVSYDDEETIQAKIKFANDLGLGGLLIWSVDQDTDDLSALSAVVGPQIIALQLKSTAEDSAYWQGVSNPGCYVTDCGATSCKPGFQKIEQQPCGKAKFLTRHSTEADSLLCCPLSSSPDKDECQWRSSAPECNGRCEPGEVLLQLNKWGDGKYCENGHKAYCCETPTYKQNNCYFAGKGKSCKSGDEPLTWHGQITRDYEKLDPLYRLKGRALREALEEGFNMDSVDMYCCPPDDLKRWDSCAWRGEPDQGNCFDGHCKINTEVAVTWAGAGGGRVCGGIDPGRVRVFCCAPPKGETLFLPVDLDHLFPNPPTGDDVDTQFDLNVDDTWGGSHGGDPNEDEPGDSAFQFYVLASPTEIQVSLDKRDGSHWELFNCNDAVSGREQTVQMICTDDSEDSNCGDIFKGHGAPGTILEMPKGCGPGKYAVAKSLEVSKNQTLPPHLRKRNIPASAKVYDLTFDYDFTRVPRDFGDTQLRIDYSNQEGYWDRIVAAPAGKKKKRSLAEFGGNHKRWLEEEWRDDYHRGALSKEELHKRWFGEDVLDWLRELLHVDIKLEKRHTFEEEVSAVIMQEDWTCGPFKAKIDAVATAGIKMSTSFGITIITTLGPGMDLSNSFMHFNNEGEIEAILTVDASMRMDWDSKPFTITTIPIPGGTFTIWGIATLGPRFDLDAQFKAGISIQGRFEARAELANWEIRQTYPHHDEVQPQAVDAPKRQFPTSGIASPQIEASVVALGYAEAHIIPKLAFGIKFDKQWDIEDAEVSLRADLYGRVEAKSDVVGGDCEFGYKVEAGVQLIADAEVPSIFHWNPSPYTFGKLDKRIVPSDSNQQWECVTGGAASRRDAFSSLPAEAPANHSRPARTSLIGSGLRKRAVPYPKAISLPSAEKLCPRTNTGPPTECLQTFAADSVYSARSEDYEYLHPTRRRRELDDLDDFHAADTGGLSLDPRNGTSPSSIVERRDGVIAARAVGKRVTICKGVRATNIHIKAWNVNGNFPIWDNHDWATCNDFDFGPQPGRQNVPRPGGSYEPYPVEHVLEGQLLTDFLARSSEETTFSDICRDMGNAWFSTQTVPGHMTADGNPQSPWQYIADGYPYSAGSRPAYQAHHEEEFVRVIESVNIMKEFAFKFKDKLPGNDKMQELSASEDTVDQAIRTMKIVLMTYKYLAADEIRELLYKQAHRVGDRMSEMEDFLRDSGLSEIQGLKNMWIRFVKGRTELAAGKLRIFLTSWMPVIERTLYGTDSSQDDQTRATLRRKIEALREQVDKLPRFRNPF